MGTHSTIVRFTSEYLSNCTCSIKFTPIQNLGQSTPIYNMTNTAHKVHCMVQTTHLYLIILKLTLISPLNHLCLTINSFIICHICPLLAESGKQSLKVFRHTINSVKVRCWCMNHRTIANCSFNACLFSCNCSMIDSPTGY